MKSEKNFNKHISSYLKELEKKGLSSLTIKRKNQHLTAFKEWLLNEEKKNISLQEVKKNHLLKFKKNLLKKEIKESTADNYLMTVNNLLEYLHGFDSESDIQKVVNHYFQTKGYSLKEIKKDAKKRKIIYSRYTRPAKDLLELAGSLERAKKAIDKVAGWAKSRNLDYAIETVFKKWPEIDKLKVKKKQKKPYYIGDPMVQSKTKNKWYVINKSGDWLEFAGDEKDIEWREE